MSGTEEPTTPAEILVDVLAAPGESRDRLPLLLGLLDDEDPEIRVSAAWAVCLVANADEETVEPITRRLLDRVADGRRNVEVTHALGYLRHRFPATVEETLAAVRREYTDREERERWLDVATGFARSDYYGGFEHTRDVGRTRNPGAVEGGKRRIYREEGHGIGGAPADAERADEDAEAEPPDPEDLAPGDGDRPTAEAERAAAAERKHREAELERAATEAHAAEVEARCRFDDLTVVAPRVEGRYSDIYRARATQGASEDAIALRLLVSPDDEEGRAAFTEAVLGRLRDWRAVSDHDNVVTLYDWGTEPCLWLVTEYVTETLYDRDWGSVAAGVRDALRIAETVAAVHERGVVHAGIDPYNVAYPVDTFEEHPEPMVTNFGLLDVVRMYFEPSEYLDPRYAAPEYFDRKYGPVDRMTDIYQVGAVLYYLVTGTPPFEGDFGTVREGVLNDQPPAPSTVADDVPAAVDEVVRKAMAKAKLTRYETATHLAGELAEVLPDG